MTRTKATPATPATFTLDDLDVTAFTMDDPGRRTPEEGMAELEAWADQQLAPRPEPQRHDGGGWVVWDIETGPRPEDELRAIYREKTLEEFADSCDKRWKPETVAAKFEEYKATAWQQFLDKAALSPITGRVLLIGCLWPGSSDPFFIDQADERTLLESWWDMVSKWLADKVSLIGHNSNAFDLPFLVRRSWCLGVSVPCDVYQGRYWHPLFGDTMDRWACGGRDFVSLSTLAAFFGVGQKIDGVSGADFAKLWSGSPEERKLAREYNAQDLRLTAAIAAKMGMI